jgi:hypothetical protein
MTVSPWPLPRQDQHGPLAPRRLAVLPLRLEAAAEALAEGGVLRAGAKGAVSAQKLGQLQPFVAALPWECLAQLVSFGPT